MSFCLNYYTPSAEKMQVINSLPQNFLPNACLDFHMKRWYNENRKRAGKRLAKV